MTFPTWLTLYFFSHLIFAVLDSPDDHLQNSVSMYSILENACHTFTSIFPLFCRLKPPKIKRRSWEVLLTWIFIAGWGQKQETRDIATCPFSHQWHGWYAISGLVGLTDWQTSYSCLKSTNVHEMQDLNPGALSKNFDKGHDPRDATKTGLLLWQRFISGWSKLWH